MKVYFHPLIMAQQAYACSMCGHGCRSFLIPVTRRERERIGSLENWNDRLHLRRLFVRSRDAGRAGYGIVRHSDGSCIFLGDDNLCLIHKIYGMRAKPLACQLYPFVLNVFAGHLRVGLRFDCPAVCRNRPGNLNEFKHQIRQLAGEIVGDIHEGGRGKDITAGGLADNGSDDGESFLTVRQKLPNWRIDAINEILIAMVDSNALSLLQRLHWIRIFISHVSRVNWGNVADDEFDGLLSLLKGGILAELDGRDQQEQQEAHTGQFVNTKPNINTKVVTAKARKLMGQVFFLLCHSAAHSNTHQGVLGVIRSRFSDAAMLRRLGNTQGLLPKLQSDWPDCDLDQLENSFGPWPDDVEKMLSRYLLCRIASGSYCGINFYNYSLVEGVNSLLLAMVTIGWLMRLEAVKAGRKCIKLTDAQKAIMTIDGNLGYGRALGAGTSRLRLQYLVPYLGGLINCYCA